MATWARAIPCNVSAFGQLFGDVVKNADEGRVVADPADVHRLTEVRGQLRVGEPIDEFRDPNVYLLTGAEFATEVRMVLSFFEPTSDGVLVGLIGGLKGFGGELTIHINELLRTFLWEAEFFEDGVGLVLGLGVKGVAFREFVFVLVRDAGFGFLFLSLFGLGFAFLRRFFLI